MSCIRVFESIQFLGLVLPLNMLSGKRNSDSRIVQEAGITIDMTRLATVTVNRNKTVASVGAGASWLDVYLYLDGLGVAVAGGRNAAVGVGGLTLGGQSFLLFPAHYLVLTCSRIRRHFLLRPTRRMGL